MNARVFKQRKILGRVLVTITAFTLSLRTSLRASRQNLLCSMGEVKRWNLYIKNEIGLESLWIKIPVIIMKTNTNIDYHRLSDQNSVTRVIKKDLDKLQN